MGLASLFVYPRWGRQAGGRVRSIYQNLGARLPTLQETLIIRCRYV